MTNVKELRLLLDKLESEWSQEDTKHLGNFEDIPFYIECTSSSGLGHCDTIYDGTLGFLMLEENK